MPDRVDDAQNNTRQRKRVLLVLPLLLLLVLVHLAVEERNEEMRERI